MKGKVKKLPDGVLTAYALLREPFTESTYGSFFINLFGVTWVSIEVLPVHLCKHIDTLCNKCVDDFEKDSFIKVIIDNEVVYETERGKPSD